MSRTPSYFGRRLADLRHARRLSQSELAKLAGVSAAYIADMEQGQRQGCRLDTAAKLARALKVKLEDFVEPKGATA